MQLVVEINGAPTGGSPYPVFFSPPESECDAAAALAEGNDATASAATNSLAATAQEVARMLQPDLAKASEAAAALLAQQNSMVCYSRQPRQQSLLAH